MTNDPRFDVSPRKRPARNVPTGDGARALLPAVELIDSKSIESFWCDCGRRVLACVPHIIARRVGDADGVFDVRWCSIACRAQRLGRAA